MWDQITYLDHRRKKDKEKHIYVRRQGKTLHEARVLDSNISKLRHHPLASHGNLVVMERLHELEKGMFSALKPSDLLHTDRNLELKKGTWLAHLDEP